MSTVILSWDPASTNWTENSTEMSIVWQCFDFTQNICDYLKLVCRCKQRALH